MKPRPTRPRDDRPAEDAASTVGQGGKYAESLALIEELLARPDLSKQARRELKDYKEDIADGEFEEGDRRYIRAVHKRLSKRR